MDVDKEYTCFFKKVVPQVDIVLHFDQFVRVYTLIQVSCNQEYTSFCHLLESVDQTPIDCRSELEHLLLLAGCYELKPTNLYNEVICSNHRNSLLSLWRRKNNCQLCVDAFNNKKRSNASLQRVRKQLALRVWNVRRLNMSV